MIEELKPLIRVADVELKRMGNMAVFMVWEEGVWFLLLALGSIPSIHGSWLSAHSNSRLGTSIGFSSWNPPIMTANFSQSPRCRSHIFEELSTRQQQPMISQPRRRLLVVHWNMSFETSWNQPPWIHSSIWPPPCSFLRLTTTLSHRGSHYFSVTWTALCLPSPVVSPRSSSYWRRFILLQERIPVSLIPAVS